MYILLQLLEQGTLDGFKVSTHKYNNDLTDSNNINITDIFEMQINLIINTT